METRRFACALAACGLSLAACSLFKGIGLAPNEVDPEAVRIDAPAGEPAHVVVRHVLVSFEGTDVPACTRSKEEARSLAEKVLADARAGRDFGELVRLYSDDRQGDGTYRMANWGVPTGADEVERQKMTRGFGNLAFALGVGEVGLLEYDPVKSPFGWHVIKRIE